MDTSQNSRTVLLAEIACSFDFMTVWVKLVLILSIASRLEAQDMLIDRFDQLLPRILPSCS